jgi:hypothetical protein
MIHEKKRTVNSDFQTRREMYSRLALRAQMMEIASGTVRFRFLLGDSILDPNCVWFSFIECGLADTFPINMAFPGFYLCQAEQSPSTVNDQYRNVTASSIEAGSVAWLIRIFKDRYSKHTASLITAVFAATWGMS